ncbi:MAG: hypothetical protein CNE38_04400 [Rhodothermaeota bacterium MED-G12]|nr:MAG: hypothetical protein CNE38_04400 [Rhodothermaeota bacterium MED-G12]|tara:strand:- start:1603 stop:2109 length:507 start_codon:yes stop_codon:yes gene_type:complete
MDILKASIDWARAELYSTSFFILFGIIFLFACLGFWQLGKTELAKAYIVPTMIAGVLLIIIGIGLFYTNKVRITQFQSEFQDDQYLFVQTELERVNNTLNEYDLIVFTIIPIMIMICSVGLVFINQPSWRASLIISIAMLIIILLIDGTAQSRIVIYQKKLTNYMSIM